MVLFKIEGFGDSALTPPLYIVQIVWCAVVPIPLIFIIWCWYRFPWTRNTRTMFSMYLSGIDSASRLIYFHYFLFRLIMIYSNGLWLDDDRGLIQLPCNVTSSNLTPIVPAAAAAVVNASQVPAPDGDDDPCRGENMISRNNCLTFSLFLYWASSWPMTSLLLLQVHALVASIIPVRYERCVTIRFALFTMCIPFCVDIVIGVLSYMELKITYLDADSPEIMDGCKFEYFCRLSVINSSYVLVLLFAIGMMSLVQLAVAYVNKRRRTQFVNAAANSPVHGWAKMPLKERVLTVVIMTCGVASFILFIIHFIVYLVQGNSTLRQILNIAISAFSFIGPIEMMWFNVDLRKAIFVLLFRRKEEDLDQQDENSEEKIDNSLSADSTEVSSSASSTEKLESEKNARRVG